MENFTVEQIDEHVEKHLGRSDELAAERKLNICSVWFGVKPVIIFARKVFFFRPKWQRVIDQLIVGLDATCNDTHAG